MMEFLMMIWLALMLPLAFLLGANFGKHKAVDADLAASSHWKEAAEAWENTAQKWENLAHQLRTTVKYQQDVIDELRSRVRWWHNEHGV